MNERALKAPPCCFYAADGRADERRGIRWRWSRRLRDGQGVKNAAARPCERAQDRQIPHARSAIARLGSTPTAVPRLYPAGSTALVYGWWDQPPTPRHARRTLCRPAWACTRRSTWATRSTDSPTRFTGSHTGRCASQHPVSLILPGCCIPSGRAQPYLWSSRTQLWFLPHANLLAACLSPKPL